MTVWVALELLLAKAATDRINIEPKSHEDIEAAVSVPDDASLAIGSSIEDLNLVIQIKSRSTSPWASAGIADVLLGVGGSADSSGSRARTRPLSMLEADPKMRYVFITNESLSQPLRPYESDGLLEFPEVSKLPPYARAGYSIAAEAALAPRLALCSGVTLEVLEARISRILSTHAHIARDQGRKACLRDLKDAVRTRMSAYPTGVWTAEELLQTIRQHGGSALPTLVMDYYVKPRSFKDVRQSLIENHAVVISGPSGTGKTLTAEILENELQSLDFPFSVVTEEGGPGSVRDAMKSQDPLLFHLRDPWGSNRVEPGADPWVNELPKLLASAGPNRKFLVTSRSDILQSAGIRLAKQLERYTVAIEIEDYGASRLAQIYDRRCIGLAGHPWDLAQAYREDALRALKRPYELDRFIYALMSEPYNSKRTSADIIKDSQIDAISSVVASQVRGLEEDGISCAAVVWAMLSKRPANPS